jgi:hypothetical protein
MKSLGRGNRLGERASDEAFLSVSRGSYALMRTHRSASCVVGVNVFAALASFCRGPLSTTIVGSRN